MRRKSELVLVMAVVITAYPLATDAMMLGTRTMQKAIDVGGLDETQTRVDLVIDYSRGDAFIGWTVTPEDVGETFFASAETHPSNRGFNGVVPCLTDGEEEDELYFGIVIYDNTGGGGSYSSMMDSSFTKAPGIATDYVDFYGYEITEISLTLDSLILDTSAGYVSADADATITIWGVPEPGTILLLGLGAVMVRKR